MRKQPTFRRKKLPQARSRQQTAAPSSHPLSATSTINDNDVYEEPQLPTWTKQEDVIDYLSEDEVIPSQQFAVVSMLSLSKWRTGRQREDAIEAICKKEGYDVELATKIIDAWAEFSEPKRALKLRGVFEKQKAAYANAKTLRDIHKTHNVGVCSVGKWVPFDPNPEHINDQNYMENEMNQLKEGYAMNLEKGKVHFAEQKAEKAARARIDGSKWGQEMNLKRKETKQEVEHRIKSAEEDIAQYTEKIKIAKQALEQAQKKVEYMAEHPEVILEEEDTPIDYDNVPKEVTDEIKERQKVADANRDKLAVIESQRKQFSRLPQPAVQQEKIEDAPAPNSGPLEEQLLLPHQAREQIKAFDAERESNVKTI